MKIKKGLEFLPDTSLKKLERMYKKEKNSRAKVRLLCAIHRKEGKSLPKISKETNIPTTTINDSLYKIQMRGLGARYDSKKEGRPSKLNKKEQEDIKAILRKSPEEQNLPFRIWDTKLLMFVISERYKINYKQRNIERLVKVWGFSFKKARPEHKFADEKEQEAFKKNFQQKLNHTYHRDGRHYILMKASSR
jgi:transposase